MNRPSQWLKGLAWLHMMVGVVLYREPLLAWAQAGFVNAIDPHMDRNAAFWFLLFGWGLFLLAQLLADFEARQLPLPDAFLKSWLALGLVSTLAMALSGLPLVLLVALLIWNKQRRLT